MELPVTSANVRPAGSIVWQSGLLIGLVLLAVSALSLMLGIVAQLALAWTLRDPVVTSTLIGASKTAQIDDAVGALRNLSFSADELTAINTILG